MLRWRSVCLFAVALLTACESADAGFAPLAPFQDAGDDDPGPPMVTPGDGDGGASNDAGVEPGGDGRLEPEAVWLSLTTATGNTGLLDTRTLRAGRQIIQGEAYLGFVTTDGRLIFDHERQALELVCDSPCSIAVSQATVATDPLENDLPLAELTCGALVVSREDEVWNGCGERLWTDSEDPVEAASGDVLAIHDGRIALVAAIGRLSLQDLNSGDITQLDDSELHAQAMDLLPSLVRTVEDGFWVLVSAADDGAEAVRYHVSLAGGITRDGTYRSLQLPQTTWELGPGTLAADGSMYKILHYDNLDTGFSNDALIRIELDQEPTVAANILIDTGPSTEFESLDALVTGP
jgi:hypothetical protein